MADTGIPTLLGGNEPAPAPELMNADAAGISQSSTPVQWGIYQNGAPIVLADSVISVEYRREWHVSDYPQEEGAFQSYNKVSMPFDARVTLAKGGTDSDRLNFLSTLEQIGVSTDLYEVWTAERTYLNANIVRIDYARKARDGAGLIKADVWLVEVRNTATAKLSNTKTQSGSDPVSDGTVQAIPATPSQARLTANPTAGGR